MPFIKDVNSETFKTIFLSWVLMVLLALLAIQMIMMSLGLNRVHASQVTAGSTPIIAQLGSQKSTFSYGSLHATLSEDDRKQVIIGNQSVALDDQSLGTTSGLTREQVQQQKIASATQVADSTTNNISLKSLSTNVINTTYYDDYTDFNIFDAYASLFDDFDYDGFYRTFNVVFDADYYGNHDHADVYAELYLSQDGGPWYHYYTTEAFTIVGDSEMDSYEVITTLYEDYSDDYYDVLIDLYQVGYPGVVATISSDDTDALYALPLESEEFDTDYYHDDYDYDEHYDHHDDHHGSLFMLLALMLLAISLRQNWDLAVN